ncbi:MAG: ribosomal RNA small subunit methyltransferase A [Planctomycetes bacterium]|nr:ribosomal RNA small subunit methyltransferase A [Planctomycetota bacterium]
MTNPRVPRSPREIASFFRALGSRPFRSLGQNFLTDPGTLERITDAAEVGRGDRVVEVGSGLGTLTRVLAERAGYVRAVEIDDRLLRACRASLPPGERLGYWRGDCLAAKSALDPDLEQEIDNDARRFPDFAEKWVGNLPYSIATPLLVQLLATRGGIARVVATVQREVADRLVASPGGDAYGALAVVAGLAARARITFTLPPGAFWPPPKVDSAVVVIEPLSERPRGISELARRLPLLFSQRRKTLGPALSRTLLGGVPAAEARRRIEALGIDSRRRLESLSPGEFLALLQLLDVTNSGAGSCEGGQGEGIP